MPGLSRRLALAALLLWSFPAVLEGQVGTPVDLRPDRLITLRVEDAPLAEVLERLRRVYRVPLAWSPDLLPDGQRVTVDAEGVSVAGLLRRILVGTPLVVEETAAGTFVIREGAPALPSERNITTTEDHVSPLHARVEQLEQIVVTGTPFAGTPNREQPAAVSVLSPDGSAAPLSAGIAELLRQEVPGLVLWNFGPGGEPSHLAGSRGVSSFTTRSLKAYIDGVEVASPDLFPLLDARSIEHMEIIRGPQGAALYGSGALNGVIQIVSAKGQPGRSKQGELAGRIEGGTQARVAEDRSLRQQHGFSASRSWSAGSAEGSARIASTSNGAFPGTWAGSLHVGGQMVTGAVLLAASGWGQRWEFVDRTGVDSLTRIQRGLETDFASQTGGALSAIHQISADWHQTLIVGYDRANGALPRSPPGVPPRIPLGATHETSGRITARYSLAGQLPRVGVLGPEGTLGLDYSRLERARDSLLSPVVRPVTTRLFSDELTNVGLFGQLRVRAPSQLLVTVGTRADWHTAWAGSGRPVWSSMVGASWTIPQAASALRVRASWGRAVRAPDPEVTRAMETPLVDQLENTSLAPEVQHGFEAGLDLYFGARARVGLTGYHQTAEGLVFPAPVSGSAPNGYQYQNLGAVRNRGGEVEGEFVLGEFALSGSLFLTWSSVLRTGDRYAGELMAGDRILEVPDAGMGLAARWHHGRIGIGLGATWLGSWIGWDWELLRKVAEGRAEPLASLRDYWIRYNGRPKLQAELDYEIRPAVHALVKAENAFNTLVYERDNMHPGLRRVILAGVELRR